MVGFGVGQPPMQMTVGPVWGTVVVSSAVPSPQWMSTVSVSSLPAWVIEPVRVVALPGATDRTSQEEGRTVGQAGASERVGATSPIETVKLYTVDRPWASVAVNVTWKVPLVVQVLLTVAPEAETVGPLHV